ncbi:hypothetical protein D3C85_1366630 [compost metagenome]
MGDAVVFPQQVIQTIRGEADDGARLLLIGRRRRETFNLGGTTEGGRVIGEGAGGVHLLGAAPDFGLADDGDGGGGRRRGGGDDLGRVACGFGQGQGFLGAVQVGDLKAGHQIGSGSVEADLVGIGRHGHVAGLLGGADQAAGQDVAV